MPLQLIAFNPSKKRKAKKRRGSAKKRKARRMTAAQKKYFAPAPKSGANKGGPNMAKKKKRRKGGWFSKKRRGRGKTQTANSSPPPSGRRRRFGGGGGGRKISVRQLGAGVAKGLGVGVGQIALGEAQKFIIESIIKPETPINPHIVSAAEIVATGLLAAGAQAMGFRGTAEVLVMTGAAAALTNSYAYERMKRSESGIQGLGGLAFGPAMNVPAFVQGGIRLSA